jgi:hypothetical protein
MFETARNAATYRSVPGGEKDAGDGMGASFRERHSSATWEARQFFDSGEGRLLSWHVLFSSMSDAVIVRQPQREHKGSTKRNQPPRRLVSMMLRRGGGVKPPAAANASEHGRG